MSGDFVNDQIGIDDTADKFPAGPGGADTVKNKFTGLIFSNVIQGLKKSLDGNEGPA